MSTTEVAAIPQQEPAPERLRLDYVDGLRAAAALLVVLNHTYGTVFLNQVSKLKETAIPWLAWSMIYGHFSVSIFIVVSGFCLMLPVARNADRMKDSLGVYLKRRARRILPPYYFALALALVLIATVLGARTYSHWDMNIQYSLRDIAAHVLLVQNFFGTGRINYVFWSIAVEWQIYFLFPILIWLFRRLGAPITACIALAVGYALMLGLGHTRVARANPHYIGLFTLGMWAAWLAVGNTSRAKALRDGIPWGRLAIGSGLIVVAATIMLGLKASKVNYYLDLPAGICAFAVLIAASRPGRSALRSVLEWRPLVSIGAYSYSLYLTHALTLQIVWQFVLRRMDVSDQTRFWLLLGPGMAIHLGGAYLFYLCCERPFLNKPRQKPA